MKKNIFVKENYQPAITNLEHEKQTTIDSIKNIYSLCKNENNQNNLEYSLISLSDTYKYVHKKFHLLPGSYIRYIDTSNHQDMKLKLGGFVISDNGYSIVFKNPNNFVKLNKKHCIIFVYITYNEQLKCTIE